VLGILSVSGPKAAVIGRAWGPSLVFHGVAPFVHKQVEPGPYNTKRLFSASGVFVFLFTSVCM
jgi:hypothetical protein